MRGLPLNLYIAWYDSQQGGRSAHSPRSCLPAGGWQIESFETVPVAGIQVNRVLIALGNQRQLVYYWFQQRGRVITNEYAVKWYLFVDAVTRRRTDGALVRLVAPVPSAAAVGAADAERGGSWRRWGRCCRGLCRSDGWRPLVPIRAN